MGGAGTHGMVTKKTFDAPDEVRTPYKGGRVDVLDVGDWPVKRVSLEPGWRWTEHTRPVAGTDLCEVFHVKLILGGKLAFRTTDGTESEFSAGEIALVDAPHDAWVVGSETCSFIDLAEIVRTAVPAS